MAKKVFIEDGPRKARKIRYSAKYWLLNKKLPTSRHGNQQKTARLIDEEIDPNRINVVVMGGLIKKSWFG